MIDLLEDQEILTKDWSFRILTCDSSRRKSHFGNFHQKVNLSAAHSCFGLLWSIIESIKAQLESYCITFWILVLLLITYCMNCELFLPFCVRGANLVQVHIHWVVKLTFKENTGWSLLKFGIILQK